MNFKSENALKAAKRVSDHHKGWQLCTVPREALVRELVVPWVRAQLGMEHPELSPDKFFKFLMSKSKVSDKTYLMISDLVFEILDSIFMYRSAIGQGNASEAFAARAKVAKIWYGRTHPSYRELEMADSILLA